MAYSFLSVAVPTGLVGILGLILLFFRKPNKTIKNTPAPEQSDNKREYSVDQKSDVEAVPVNRRRVPKISAKPKAEAESIVQKTREQRAEELKLAGNKYFVTKNYIQATKFYSDAIDLTPENAIFYSNRAASYFYLKQVPASLKDANKAIELDPKYIKAYTRKALCLVEMNDFEEAVNKMQRNVSDKRLCFGIFNNSNSREAGDTTAESRITVWTAAEHRRSLTIESCSDI